MTESTRTISFVVAAAVSVALAFLLTPSLDVTDQELAKQKQGQPFFPDFTNPNDATSIRVVAYDEARAAPKVFAVEFKNGLWTIPSHHSYPADGATRLPKTAVSCIGIKRDQFISSSKEQHETLGVVDPLDQDATKLKGRGQRLTLKKGENELVDLIIGKQVKDRPHPESGGYYYVRKAGEDSTYVAKLDLDLSTKFSDWVETDLLKLNRDDLSELIIDDYSIDQGRGVITKEVVTRLTRAKSTDPWTLDGLDTADEEVDLTRINDMIQALTGLKLNGIRPKPKGLRADLTVDREFVQNDLDMMQLANDLQQKGFFPIKDAGSESGARLYSKQGELAVVTSKGIVYKLQFGEVFTGDEKDIEIGGEGDQQKDDAAKADKGEAKDTADEENDESDKPAIKEGKKSSRYLFVSAAFDPKYLGASPKMPAPPEGLPPEEAAKVEKKELKPAKSKAGETKPSIKPGKKAAKKPARKKEIEPDEESVDGGGQCGPGGPVAVADEPADDQPDAKNETEEKDSATKDADKKPADDKEAADAKKDGEEGDEAKDAGEQKEDEKPAPEAKKKTITELKRDYEDLLRKYQFDLKAYDDNVTAGEEKAKELNLRFGEWYYVISADSFSKLHLNRKDLIKPKAKPTGDKPSDKPAGASIDEGDPAEPDAAPESEADAPKSDPEEPEAKEE